MKYKKKGVLKDIYGSKTYKGYLYVKMKIGKSLKIQQYDKNLNLLWESPEEKCMDYRFFGDVIIYNDFASNKVIGRRLPEMELLYEIEGEIISYTDDPMGSAVIHLYMRPYGDCLFDTQTGKIERVYPDMKESGRAFWLGNYIFEFNRDTKQFNAWNIDRNLLWSRNLKDYGEYGFNPEKLNIYKFCIYKEKVFISISDYMLVFTLQDGEFIRQIKEVWYASDMAVKDNLCYIGSATGCSVVDMDTLEVINTYRYENIPYKDKMIEVDSPGFTLREDKLWLSSNTDIAMVICLDPVFEKYIWSCKLTPASCYYAPRFIDDTFFVQDYYGHTLLMYVRTE